MSEKAKISHNKLKLRCLCDEDKLEEFQLDDEDLFDFFINDAKRYQNWMLGRTYLCIYDEKIVGFLTICMASIKAEIMQKEDRVEGVVTKEYPALKIARLAVDDRFVGRDIGTFLILASIGKALQLSEQLGCRLLIVDAKKPSVSYYEKFDFNLMKKHQKRDYPTMYLDLYPLLPSFFHK